MKVELMKCDVMNANRRIYPKAVVEKIAEQINNRKAPLPIAIPDDGGSEVTLFAEFKNVVGFVTHAEIVDGTLMVEADPRNNTRFTAEQITELLEDKSFVLRFRGTGQVDNTLGASMITDATITAVDFLPKEQGS